MFQILTTWRILFIKVHLMFTLPNWFRLSVYLYYVSNTNKVTRARVGHRGKSSAKRHEIDELKKLEECLPILLTLEIITSSFNLSHLFYVAKLKICNYQQILYICLLQSILIIMKAIFSLVSTIFQEHLRLNVFQYFALHFAVC